MLCIAAGTIKHTFFFLALTEASHYQNGYFLEMVQRLCQLNYNSNEPQSSFVCGKSYVMRLNRFQTDESIDQRSALFILDDLSSKYFQSVAQRLKMCKGSVGHFQASGS